MEQEEGGDAVYHDIPDVDDLEGLDTGAASQGGGQTGSSGARSGASFDSMGANALTGASDDAEAFDLGLGMLDDGLAGENDGDSEREGGHGDQDGPTSGMFSADATVSVFMMCHGVEMCL